MGPVTEHESLSSDLQHARNCAKVLCRRGGFERWGHWLRPMHRYKLNHDMTEPPMSTAPKFVSMAAPPGGIRFILVNDRVPRSDPNCALCCKKIEQGYVRELQTRLVYCDPQCFFGHQKMAFLAVENRARKVSS